jgi:hypothetical protein
VEERRKSNMLEILFSVNVDDIQHVE